MSKERDEETLELYAKYLLMPLAYDIEESEIYNRDYVVFTGRAFCHPHPHRHFTLKEFKEKLMISEAFKKFCENLKLPN